MMAQSQSLRSRRRHRTRCLLLLFLCAVVGGMQLCVLWLAPFDADWKILSLPASDKTSQKVLDRTGVGSGSHTTKKKKFAYAFYSTTAAYACGAFVQVAQLKDLGTPSSIDFVLLTYGEASTNPGIIEQASKLNVIIKAVEHLPILGVNVGNGRSRRKDRTGHNTYYTDVMVKLRIFELYEYDRVVYMDTDMMVRQNLDHLFEDKVLPFSSLELAAAKVTNRKNTNVQRFCSCFMVFQPSVQLWSRIMKYYSKNHSNHGAPIYDMDLLNLEFQSQVTLLPGSYGMLTAIWDNNHNLTTPAVGVDAVADDITRQWYHKILQGSPGWPSPSQSNPKSRRDLFQESLALHFTPNKPMVERNLANIRRSQPHADPQYYATFEKWYSLASYVCPFDGQLSKVHKYDKHRLSKFDRSNQYSDYFN